MYNCTGGKLTRGYTVALSLKLLCKNEELSTNMMTNAYVLGWCVEMVIFNFKVIINNFKPTSNIIFEINI